MADGTKQLLATYEHTEGVAANVWTITHNLGTEYPVVDVFVDAGQTAVDPTDDELFIPFSVVVTDENIVVITLENAAPNNYTGRALVA